MDHRIVGRALANAQRLMNDDNFNAAVAAKRGTITEESYNTTPVIDSQPRYRQGVDPMAYSGLDESQINTNLPKEILEAMISNPIDMSAAPGAGGSVLDTLENYEELERRTPVARPATRRINEQTPSTSFSTPAMAVDYNYIKYLIDESIKSNLEEMKKVTLNEGVLGGMKIKSGGVLTFVDLKGNVFEAKLTLKKKAEK